LLGNALQAGTLWDIRCVPTSDTTASQARQLGIPLTNLTEHITLDLAVDGADDVDPKLNLIKGLGRAALREKVVEIHTNKLVIVVDESKLVKRLGEHHPLPVEILPFEAAAHLRWLSSLGCRAELWLEENGHPIITDNRNYLARCWFAGGINDPYTLDQQLCSRPGILGHGLFLDMADIVVVASKDSVRVMERE
jgi:ribose 5-phosphate isomerase A